MRGRPAKPSALKMLQGNPGHRRIDTLHEPQVVVGIGEAPSYLDAAAKKFWMSQGPELVKLRTLGESDASLFAGMCMNHSRIVYLSARIEELRRKKQLSGKDENRLATFESQRIKTLSQFHKIGAEFGLGAASRTRIKLHHDDGQIALPGLDESPPSPLARIMARERSA